MKGFGLMLTMTLMADNQIRFASALNIFNVEKCGGFQNTIKCPQGSTNPAECYKLYHTCIRDKFDKKCGGDPAVLIPWCKNDGGVDENVCKERGGMLVNSTAVDESDYYDDADKDIRNRYKRDDDAEYEVLLCVPYSLICDGMMHEESDDQLDEKSCLNNGTCRRSGGGKCICKEGFEGEKCEIVKSLTTQSPTVSTKLTRCMEGDKNCSTAGYRCPYVLCEKCLPCQDQQVEKHTSGDLQGCVLSDTCGPKKTITTTCDPNCEVVAEREGTELLLGCRVQFCKENCPPAPIANPCQTLKEVNKPQQCPDCTYYEVVPKPPHKDQGCEGKCIKRVLSTDGDKCDITCKDWEPLIPCKECHLAEDVGGKNSETCKKEVKCVAMTCEQLNANSTDCIKSKGKDSIDCPKCSDSQKQIAREKCGCLSVSCIPKPPKCPDPSSKCEKYQVAVAIKCREEQRKRCGDKCNNPEECQCQKRPEMCPAGFDLVWKKCPTDCGKCCNEICQRNAEGILEMPHCVLNCEVCSDMAGAKLNNVGVWDNNEYCNSDKRCCTGCRQAEHVAVCPASWNTAKKFLCRCRCGCKSVIYE